MKPNTKRAEHSLLQTHRFVGKVGHSSGVRGLLRAIALCSERHGTDTLKAKPPNAFAKVGDRVTLQAIAATLKKNWVPSPRPRRGTLQMADAQGQEATSNSSPLATFQWGQLDGSNAPPGTYRATRA